MIFHSYVCLPEGICNPMTIPMTPFWMMTRPHHLRPSPAVSQGSHPNCPRKVVDAQKTRMWAVGFVANQDARAGIQIAQPQIGQDSMWNISISESLETRGKPQKYDASASYFPQKWHEMGVKSCLIPHLQTHVDVDEEKGEENEHFSPLLAHGFLVECQSC